MLQIFGWQSDSNKLTCCHAYSCVLVERKWLMFTCEWWELFVTMSDNAWQCVTMRVLVNDDICLWQCVTMCYNAWQCMTIRDWCRCVYSWMMRSVRYNACSCEWWDHETMCDVAWQCVKILVTGILSKCHQMSQINNVIVCSRHVLTTL